MYLQEAYNGEGLPPKCLCLTYDDGPGKNTFEIAQFLYEQNIKATFFVVGKYAIQHDDVLQKVANLGHLIANHTFEHPDMPYYLSKNGDVQNQILRTDAIIKKYNNGNTIYFRSPYGKWSKEVADELNSNILSAINHVGPIHWDIAGIDCYYWKKGISIEDTVQKYLLDIHEKDHGIVVMHDEIADMNFLQVKNKTLHLTKKLIPILKAEGYTFVRLDEIKSVKEDASKPLSVTIQNKRGKYLHLKGDNSIGIGNKKNTRTLSFTIQDAGLGKFNFCASNGLFVSLQEQSNNVIKADKKETDDDEEFDLIPLHTNKFFLRANNGHYLTSRNKEKNLTATAEFMRGAEIFTIVPTGLKIKTRFSLSKELKSLKRQILYVLSKLKQVGQ